MAYEKQTFVNNSTVLTAEHLEHIEDGIYQNSMAIDEIKTGSPVTISEVTLLAGNWVGEGNLFSQVVSINGVTENSQVNLAPSVEQLAIFYDKDITFVTENDGGVVTVYVIGQKPQNDYTIQADIVEVIV